MSITVATKSHSPENQAALDAFFARRGPTGAFKAVGKIEKVKGKSKMSKVYGGLRTGNHVKLRVRHDLREYIESTRAA